MKYQYRLIIISLFSIGFLILSVFAGDLVTRVIDGDTIVLEDGRKVRLIGVDTPEQL